ncbi:hypothetical protein [Amycolatopsis circi]|uniref:hypothetical protein n=1 Tax=Amycolatopsis circi TaxID=871959 RepID=UPI001FC929FF|nr:hypothetical protein [Amycolatopsis circi]
MAANGLGLGTRPQTDRDAIVRAVSGIMGTVVGLTFLFGFGNVLTLALRLGVPLWVAPLAAPAVDLSILGLLLATRHLALVGAPPGVLRPVRCLLIVASVVTLALNVAEPRLAGQFGKAAFDAVGPLLLIGWSEVGPGLLPAIGNQYPGEPVVCQVDPPECAALADLDDGALGTRTRLDEDFMQSGIEQAGRSMDALLIEARREDAAHRAVHQKPISADTLRARLGIGAARARRLVKAVRSEFEDRAAADPRRGIGE